jgi:predicted methyltransferase
MRRPTLALLAALLVPLPLACPPGPSGAAEPASSSPSEVIPEAVSAAVEAPDRSPEDRALDAGREPARLLTFFGIRPGMRVAELGAGGGYTTELLARVVGPEGRVYGQNSRLILERFAEIPWTGRLTKDVMRNVVRLDRPFDDPFPADVRDLDAVLIVLFYHDTVWMEVDRRRMNQAVLRALAPGGVYGIVDHAARSGVGVADAQTLHRIEESVVREEVEAAGFQLARQGDFLRDPLDTRDWNASPREAGERRGTSDRFVLAFVKPGGPGS